MKPSENCIFCGSTAKLTSEHMFGKWMKRNIKSKAIKTLHLTSFFDLDATTGQKVPSMAKGKLNRPGSPHSHQLHLVCDNCNNVWMGALQENAKPHVLALSSGNWSDLTLEAVSALSSWATMVTMCLEFADLKTQTVSSAERETFRGVRTPGSNWIVCFGRCQDYGDPGAMWHRSARFIDEGVFPDTFPHTPDTQTTTVFVGQCFFHTLSGPSHVLPNAIEYTSALGIRQFWPLPDSIPTIPLVYTQAGVSRVATKFWVDRGSSPEPHFGLLTN